MDYRWNADKDARLRGERGIGFEELVTAMEAGGLLRDLEHPQVERFGHQRVFWVLLNGQVWVIPYVLEGKDECFLKTAYPSRKAARLFRQGGSHEKA
jgi:hypothetical protein